tara:strand:+ start:5694 stop:5963 length:270 start_codon:yes stop_codon:yes gene_type:complete
MKPKTFLTILCAQLVLLFLFGFGAGAPISLAQEEKTETQVEATAPKSITLTLTPEEAIYVTQLVGKQPTESGAFQLWAKLRSSIEEQSK